MRCMWIEEGKKKKDKGKISVERVRIRPYSEYSGSASILTISHSTTFSSGHGGAGKRIQAVYVVFLGLLVQKINSTTSSVPQLSCARSLHTQVLAPESTSSALHLICSQPSQYVIANFLGRKYILTPRDLLTVPRIPDVKVGDVLTLDAIEELGSRDYTLRGSPTIPTSKVKVDATVIEHTKGPMEFIFKKKRRKGYRKTIQHKQPCTRLRIGRIEIPLDSTHKAL